MKSLLTALGLCLLFPLSVFAGTSEVEKALAAALPQFEIKSITESKMDGMYRVVDQRGQIIFASSDGQHFVTGELYSTSGGQLLNVSEQERQGTRVEQLANLKEGDRITFPANGRQKAHITVVFFCVRLV